MGHHGRLARIGIVSGCVVLLALPEARACRLCRVSFIEAIRRATFCVVGEIESVDEEKSTATIEVEEVLFGDKEVGQEFEVEFHYRDGERFEGQLRIFSDSAAVNSGRDDIPRPIFTILPVCLREELMHSRGLLPEPIDTPTAIKLFQARTDLSRELARKHLLANFQEAIPQLLDMLEDGVEESIDGDDLKEESHCVERLIEALLLRPSAEGTKFILELVDEFTEDADGEVDFSDLRGARWRNFLRTTFRALAVQEPLATLVKQHVLRAIPSMEPLGIADAVVALLDADLVTVEELDAVLTDPKSQDLIAYALFFVGTHRMWDRLGVGRIHDDTDECVIYYLRACQRVRNPELRSIIVRHWADEFGTKLENRSLSLERSRLQQRQTIRLGTDAIQEILMPFDRRAREQKHSPFGYY
ncbi:MAG TPA: hypothetical protein PK668_26570 [Myxococcota bacterium]|nr:hypothetical protein [Myxococcota bacterium]HRY97093.1 hypothetical protein [Myxococcota bacterium]HSA22242.1 hypothetical protein [Myxococcota bacterium]